MLTLGRRRHIIEYMFDIGTDSSRLPQRLVWMEPPTLRTS